MRSKGQRTPRRERYQHLVSVSIILPGMFCIVLLSTWIDGFHRMEAIDDEERLYLSGDTLKQLSLGFAGLVADWYWMRSLQYVGHKILNFHGSIQIDDLGPLNARLLPSLLDTTSTLDSDFMEPYEYAAVVLPSIDTEEAIRIIKKGIDQHPSAWRLYQHLGYIYWQKRDFIAASEAYAKGAAIHGAPRWMEAMRARMAAEGGSRQVAREIYTNLYEDAGDKGVKEIARKRLLQLDSLQQKEILRHVLDGFSARTRRCPSSWREVESSLRALRVPIDSLAAPLDPAGTPYLLSHDGCDVLMNPLSPIPN